MKTASFCMLVEPSFFHAKGNSGLLCGLDIMSRSPSDEGSMIEIYFSENLPPFSKFREAFLRKNLPFLKGLLHAECIRCEGSNGVVFVRPIPNNDGASDVVVIH